MSTVAVHDQARGLEAYVLQHLAPRPNTTSSHGSRDGEQQLKVQVALPKRKADLSDGTVDDISDDNVAIDCESLLVRIESVPLIDWNQDHATEP